MKKENIIPAALLAVIAAFLVAAAVYLVVHKGSDHKATAKPVATKTADAADCVTLESGGKTVCTDDVVELAQGIQQCVATQGAETCGPAVVQQLTQACTQAGYETDGCTRDAVRLIAVAESRITGRPVSDYLAQAGLTNG